MDTRPRGSVGLFGLYHFKSQETQETVISAILGQALRIRDLTAHLCLSTRVLVVRVNHNSTELWLII